MRRLGVVILTAVLAARCGGAAESDALVWAPVPPTAPAEAGYALGVSAMYAAATADGGVFAAGGANFPDVPAAEGGVKAFYDGIYRCDGAAWQRVGSLPEPAAYGVAYGCGEGMVCAGGTNAAGALRSVWHIAVHGDQAQVTAWPDLPEAVEQAAGVALGGVLYLCGGVAGGVPSAAVWRLDTAASEPQWEAAAPLPEPLVQPVAAASGGGLYVWGGFDPTTKRASERGWRYDAAADAWSAVAGHPEGGTFVGASAATLADGRILCTGGVDREIFEGALQLPPEAVRAYQSQPVGAYRFQQAVRRYDPAADGWELLGASPLTARAGAALVVSGQGTWLLGGELKPGIRTPENYRCETLK